MDTERIVVAIASFKRPLDLAVLLRSLTSEQGAGEFRVIVVDNDPAGSARPVVEQSRLSIDYVIESQPGIAAARNAALARLPGDATRLVFVDDDEIVPEGWLAALLSASSRFHAEIACGPVRSVFPAGAPAWIERGGYIQRNPEPEGLTERLPATNNTMLALSAYERAGSPTFDESFSATGGSDSDFFSRLIALSGATVAWAPDAEVAEEVPRNRLSFRWVMRRYIRINNVSGRLLLRSTPAWRLTCSALLHIVYGLARTALAVVAGRGLRLRDTGHVTRGIGWLGAVSGRNVQEYRR